MKMFQGIFNRRFYRNAKTAFDMTRKTYQIVLCYLAVFHQQPLEALSLPASQKWEQFKYRVSYFDFGVIVKSSGIFSDINLPVFDGNKNFEFVNSGHFSLPDEGQNTHSSSEQSPQKRRHSFPYYFFHIVFFAVCFMFGRWLARYWYQKTGRSK